MFYYFIIINLANYLIIESNMLQKVSFSKKKLFSIIVKYWRPKTYNEMSYSLY